jgi:hypothetical protein
MELVNVAWALYRRAIALGNRNLSGDCVTLRPRSASHLERPRSWVQVCQVRRDGDGRTPRALSEPPASGLAAGDYQVAPRTRYTLARPMPSRLAMSVGPMPCRWRAATSAALARAVGFRPLYFPSAFA